MAASEWQSWVGRTEVRKDSFDLSRLRGMAATLDDPMTIEDGTPLSPGWHWLFFNPMAPNHELGADGHPRRGAFLPPVELPRRMWASGELTFEAPLHAGAAAVRESEIVSVEQKMGAQGTLVFVTVRHRTIASGVLAIDETQNIVYRGAAGTPTKRAAAARDSAPELVTAPRWRETFQFDEVVLFRYSALTFNGHRIHYDRPYATGVEGYPGLVVHGPLLATLLMRACARGEAGLRGKPVSLRRFSYRATAPVFVRETIMLEGLAGADGGIEVAVRREDRTLAMSGIAHPI
jgi:3-methylfumaryl-CoA hydratase